MSAIPEVYTRKRRNPIQDWQPDYIRRIELYAMFGHTPVEIALLLGVSSNTFEKWVRTRGDVQLALARGIPKAEHDLEHALFLTGCGYSHPETKLVAFEGQITDSREVTKYYPPNVEAAKFLLAKLRPEKWKEDKVGTTITIDNRSLTVMSDDELLRIAKG